MRTVRERLVFVRGRWHVVPARIAESDAERAGVPEYQTDPQKPSTATLDGSTGQPEPEPAA